MFINKMGYEHNEYGKNCQDYGFQNKSIKCVVDGCSEGKNSEIGAKLFCHLFNKNNNVLDTFSQLLYLFQDNNEIKEHLLFTIIIVEEYEEKFVVQVCGDGYIIKQNYDDIIKYEKIDYENTPPYFAYNFIDKSQLFKYKDGVKFKTFEFSKNEYKNIGCATDGLSYILDTEFKEEFEKLLIAGKENRIKLLINREYKIFKDDLTIVF